ncbi:conserved exported hypothetical protein [Pseudomonas sp. 8AS]|uniref:hypothetical protein n=1 Tax=Pseudomonas sp. 8AS TaxID=2653163 RepID=UPI0012F3DD3D|nr:hypothetical protein [Pseudomonas sp. 8AS]VXB03959.1 conserved exported hypothetical protein [Pseudomonas sp. 8AS]
MKRCILLLSISLLSACSLLGNAAKEGVISATGYPSLTRFTLEGSLPPASSLQYTAYYQPERPAACTFYSPNAGGEMPRKHIEQEETGSKAEAQTFSYRIPLAYHEAGCEMKLEAVQLNIYITYASGDFGTGTYSSGLRVYDDPPATVPHFPASGVRELRGTCMWLFRLIGKTNSLVKILTCHKADEHWQVPQDYDKRSGVGTALRRDELDGKTVRVEFQQSEEERPFYRGTWLNTESGWKPCIETDKYLRCQNPPTFRTFQMNGRECTVYPNCTE